MNSASPNTVTIDATHSETGRAGRRSLYFRSLLIAACSFAAFGSANLGDPNIYVEADPELSLLLRTMALIKASMVALVLVVLLWRFSWPLSTRLGITYVVGAAMAVGACVMIWQLVHIAAAAVVFHLGALALILGAVLDRSDSMSPRKRFRRRQSVSPAAFPSRE